jgi:DUF1016 N-terminal domain
VAQKSSSGKKNAAWGSAFIDQFSRDLKVDFPDISGFSAKNLRYCRAFYRFYSDAAIWQQAVAKLTHASQAPPHPKRHKFIPDSSYRPIVGYNRRDFTPFPNPTGVPMDKKYFISWLIMFIAWMAGSFVVHGVLLHDDYAKLPNLFRSETDSQKYMHLMLLAHVIMAGAMVWIYRLGVQNKPWLGQGLRFGLAVVLLNIVPYYTIYYVVQPMPGAMVIWQIALDGALVLLLGVLLAFLYRQSAST